MFTKKFPHSLWLAAILIIHFAVAANAQTNTIRVAVLDFDMPRQNQALRAISLDLNRKITNKIESRLVSLGAYQMIERLKLDRILREQNLARDGRIDPETAAKLGRILGVDAIIYGSVDGYLLDGIPDRGSYTLNDVKVMVKVHFKLTNTTNGLLQISEEAIGESPAGKAKPQSAQRTSKWSDLLQGILDGNKRQPASRVTRPGRNELITHCQKLTEEAVDGMVSNITQRIQDVKKPPVVDNKLAGQVIRVSGSTVYITGINRELVNVGDKLIVRRSASETVGGRTVSFTEKIGEAEITEVQDTVVVGRFSSYGPDLKVQRGDQVTNQN